MSQNMTAYFTRADIESVTIVEAIESAFLGTIPGVKFSGNEKTITHGELFSVTGDAQGVMLLIGRLGGMGYANLVRVNRHD